MPRNLTEIKAPERRRIRATAEREGISRVDAAERFNISYSAAKSILYGLLSYDGVNRSLVQREAQARKNAPRRMAFTRATFADGAVLTVSHGEGEDYARSMVEAMTAGRAVASVEIVR